VTCHWGGFGRSGEREYGKVLVVGAGEIPLKDVVIRPVTSAALWARSYGLAIGEVDFVPRAEDGEHTHTFETFGDFKSNNFGGVGLGEVLGEVVDGRRLWNVGDVDADPLRDSLPHFL